VKYEKFDSFIRAGLPRFFFCERNVLEHGLIQNGWKKFARLYPSFSESHVLETLLDWKKMKL
jgi:hypothetical protein